MANRDLLPDYGYLCTWGRMRFTEKSLIDKLKQICPKTKVSNFDYESPPEKFTAKLKCSVDPSLSMTAQGQFTNNWIDSFSFFTGTAWKAESGFTKLKRLCYQKTYTCKRKKLNNLNVPDSDNGKEQECQAEIIFILNKSSQKKAKPLKNSFNMTITVKFHHCHGLYDPEALQAVHVSQHEEMKLEEYIDNGSTGAAAKFFHELTLLDEYEDPQILKDTSLNPSLQYVMYLVRKLESEGYDVRHMLDVMQEKKDYYDYHGSILRFHNDLTTFSMQTPSMKRTMREFGFCNIFVDAIRVPDGFTVTYVSVPTKIGAMPIGCNVIEPQGRKYMSNGYEDLRLMMCIEADLEFEPSTFYINDKNIKHSLTVFGPGKDKKKVWSTYYMCQSAWVWLNDEDNEIDKTKRNKLMVIVHKLLHSSRDKAEEVYNELQMSSYVTECPKFKEYLEDLWTTREEWICDVGMTNTFVELSLRFIREFVLHHCKALNISMMVDVVGKILENHQRQIINSFVENSDIAKIYTKFLKKANISKEGEKLLFDGSEVRKVGDQEYQIINQNNPSKYLTLRTDTMMCDCLYGKRGEFCSHLVTILNSADVLKMPELTKEDIYRFTVIQGEFDNEGKPKPPDRASPVHYNSADEPMEPNVRGVAVPIHDARGLLPGGHDSSYEEEEMLRQLQDEFDNPLERRPINNRYIRQCLMPARRQDIPIFPIPDYNISINEPTQSEAKMKATSKENSYKLVANKEQMPSASINEIPSTSTNNTESVSISSTDAQSYETALKALNNEFERLHKFFSDNPNKANLEAMTLLAKDLCKIKPDDKSETDDEFEKELDENLSDRRKKAKKRRYSNRREWDECSAGYYDCYSDELDYEDSEE